MYLNIVAVPRKGGVAWNFQVGIKGVKLSRIRRKESITGAKLATQK